MKKLSLAVSLVVVLLLRRRGKRSAHPSTRDMMLGHRHNEPVTDGRPLARYWSAKPIRIGRFERSREKVFGHLFCFGPKSDRFY